MINLSGIGHVLLRVVDEEASKRFYRDVLGFRARASCRTSVAAVFEARSRKS